MRQFSTPGTTANNVGFGTVGIEIATTNTSPGTYWLYARIAGGGRARHLYAPELLAVLPPVPVPPPTLAIARLDEARVRVDVNGVAGWRIVLQGSADLQTWRSLATNALAKNRWS